MNWLWSEDILRRALLEDIGAGDISTALLPDPSARVEGVLLAKQDGLAAGVEIALRCFELLDPGVETETLINDGSRFRRGDMLGRVRGAADCVLTAERVALNFLQRLCGIATSAAEIAARAEPHGIRIVETRKTTPGLRLFDKYAIEVGGGFSHRFDLAQSVMLKDNHFAVGGIAPGALVARARSLSGHTMRIAAEAQSPAMALELTQAGADIVMLDNFTPEQVSEAVALLTGGAPDAKKRAIIEVTGGVTPANIERYFIEGVDVISLGWLTHSVHALDISLEVTALRG